MHGDFPPVHENQMSVSDLLNCCLFRLAFRVMKAGSRWARANADHSLQEIQDFVRLFPARRNRWDFPGGSIAVSHAVDEAAILDAGAYEVDRESVRVFLGLWRG
jgi:hypothetical protein